MSNQQNEHIEKELSESIKRLEILKGNIYSLCEAEYEVIVSNHVTNEDRIDVLFDQILGFIDDDCFHELYWKLLSYVESFNISLGACYRRLEEVYFEGY